jgi:hypothetical protein
MNSEVSRDHSIYCIDPANSDVGEIHWVLDVPTDDYRAYLQSHEMLIAYMKGRRSSVTFLATLVMCLILTATLFCLINYGFTVATVYWAGGISFLVFRHILFNAEVKRLHSRVFGELKQSEPVKLIIGSKGILSKAPRSVQITPWAGIFSCVEDKSGLHLILRNYSTVAIPEAALSQLTDRGRLASFMNARIREASLA